MEKATMRQAAQSIKAGLDEWSGKLDEDQRARAIYDAGVSMHNALSQCAADQVTGEDEDRLLGKVISVHSAVTDARFMRGVSVPTQKVAVAVSAPVDQIVAINMVTAFIQDREKDGDV